MPAYQLNLPLIIFIAATFLFNLMGMERATNLIISCFLSFFSLGLISAMVSQKYQQKINLKKIQFYNGLLGILLVLSLGNGIIHWYKLLPLTSRTIIFFTLLFFILIVLLISIRTLNVLVKKLK